jgi:hypothetical protein
MTSAPGSASQEFPDAAHTATLIQSPTVRPQSAVTARCATRGRRSPDLFFLKERIKDHDLYLYLDLRQDRKVVSSESRIDFLALHPARRAGGATCPTRPWQDEGGKCGWWIAGQTVARHNLPGPPGEWSRAQQLRSSHHPQVVPILVPLERHALRLRVTARASGSGSERHCLSEASFAGRGRSRSTEHSTLT